MKKITKKQKKILLYVGISLAVVVLIYLLFFRKKQQDNKQGGGSVTEKGSSSKTPGKVITNPNWTNTTLFSYQSPMMKDKRVRLMQSAYNYVAKKQGWNTITEDSIYGPKTAQAMQKLMGKKSATWEEVKAEHLKY